MNFGMPPMNYGQRAPQQYPYFPSAQQNGGVRGLGGYGTPSHGMAPMQGMMPPAMGGFSNPARNLSPSRPRAVG